MASNSNAVMNGIQLRNRGATQDIAEQLERAEPENTAQETVPHENAENQNAQPVAHEGEIEDLRHIVVIGTFLAAVQSQCLGWQALQDPMQKGIYTQHINGTLVIGMLLSTLAAFNAVILSLFEGGKFNSNRQKARFIKAGTYCLGIVGFSLGTFVASIGLYVLQSQPRPTYAIYYAIAALGTAAPFIFERYLK